MYDTSHVVGKLKSVAFIKSEKIERLAMSADRYRYMFRRPFWWLLFGSLTHNQRFEASGSIQNQDEVLEHAVAHT